MIHLRHYKDDVTVHSVHENKEAAEAYMNRRGGCYTHADSCPCEDCARKELVNEEVIFPFDLKGQDRDLAEHYSPLALLLSQVSSVDREHFVKGGKYRIVVTREG